MVRIPALSQGPFGLTLEKSVQYIIFIYKGASCGVIIAMLLAIIILQIDLSAADVTADQVSNMTRQMILSICVCGFALAFFFLCSFLNKGVEERNRTWVFPWFLVVTVVGFGFIIMFFVSFANGFGIIQLVLPVVIVAIFYSNLLVYSFYVELGTNFVAETTPTQVVPT